VELSDGTEFGGAPHQTRLNFATSAALLDEIIDRITAAVTSDAPALRSSTPGR
jgi:bifunctional pyridoxal-dependent enzyme with beta-cystathionase and maltose regulon repressor activities